MRQLNFRCAGIAAFLCWVVLGTWERPARAQVFGGRPIVEIKTVVVTPPPGVEISTWVEGRPGKVVTQERRGILARVPAVPGTPVPTGIEVPAARRVVPKQPTVVPTSATVQPHKVATKERRGLLARFRTVIGTTPAVAEDRAPQTSSTGLRRGVQTPMEDEPSLQPDRVAEGRVLPLPRRATSETGRDLTPSTKLTPSR